MNTSLVQNEFDAIFKEYPDHRESWNFCISANVNNNIGQQHLNASFEI